MYRTRGRAGRQSLGRESPSCTTNSIEPFYCPLLSFHNYTINLLTLETDVFCQSVKLKRNPPVKAEQFLPQQTSSNHPGQRYQPTSEPAANLTCVFLRDRDEGGARAGRENIGPTGSTVSDQIVDKAPLAPMCSQRAPPSSLTNRPVSSPARMVCACVGWRPTPVCGN